MDSWVSDAIEGHLCDSSVDETTRQLENFFGKLKGAYLLSGPTRTLGMTAPREFDSGWCIGGHQPLRSGASRKITSL